MLCLFILKSKFLWKIFGPIISSATKKSDVLKKATWAPWVLFNYFVYTLFKQVPMATFPRLSTFADVRSPSRWRPTHSRPQSRLANFIFHQCASPFSFFSITWLSIGHASISACLYTWSQTPLSLVLFAPPLSCFGTITLHSCAAWYFMVDCHKNLQMTTTHKAICCIVDSFVYIFNSYSYQLNQHCARVIIIQYNKLNCS